MISTITQGDSTKDLEEVVGEIASTSGSKKEYVTIRQVFEEFLNDCAWKIAAGTVIGCAIGEICYRHYKIPSRDLWYALFPQ